MYDRIFARYSELTQTGWFGLVNTGIVTTREVWVNGRPVRADLYMPMFLYPNSKNVIVRARLAGSDAPWARQAIALSGGAVDLGVAPTGAQHAEVEVEVYLAKSYESTMNGSYERVTRVPFEGARRIWRHVGWPVLLVPTIEEAMHPITDEDAAKSRSVLGTSAASTMAPTLVADEQGAVHLGLSNFGESYWRFGPNAALGALFEVLHDGRVVARRRALYPLSHPSVASTLWGSSFFLFELEWLTEPPPQSLEGDWLIRVTSDPSIALTDIYRRRLWTGRFEVPVTKLERSFGSPFSKVRPRPDGE